MGWGRRGAAVGCGTRGGGRTELMPRVEGWPVGMGIMGICGCMPNDGIFICGPIDMPVACGYWNWGGTNPVSCIGILGVCIGIPYPMPVIAGEICGCPIGYCPVGILN